MSVKLLPFPDSRHLQAAIGWLELGNFLEANEELEKIRPVLRAHPLVLRVRWEVYAKAKKWDGALELSRTLTEMLPDDPGAWIVHANTFYFSGRTQEAYDLANEKAQKFTGSCELHYNLACYACQLGKIGEAKQCLQTAIALGGDQSIKPKALDDPDLDPLWQQIGSV